MPQVWFLNLGLGSVLFSSNALMSWASTPITFPYPSIPHAIDYPTRIITALSVADGERACLCRQAQRVAFLASRTVLRDEGSPCLQPLASAPLTLASHSVTFRPFFFPITSSIQSTYFYLDKTSLLCYHFAWYFGAISAYPELRRAGSMRISPGPPTLSIHLPYSPLVTRHSPLFPLFSFSSALFCATEHSQPLSHQSLPHSFPFNGGWGYSAY